MPSSNNLKEWLPQVLSTLILGLSYYFLSILPDGFYDRIALIISYKQVLILSMILVLIALYSLLFVKKDSKAKKEIESSISEEDKILGDLKYTRPTPTEISHDLYDQPPMSFEEHAKNYEGLKVRWIGKFYGINSRNNGEIEIILGYGSQLVCFNILLDNFPIFRTMKQGSTYIEVNGTIKSALNSIDLIDSTIISIKSIDGKTLYP